MAGNHLDTAVIIDNGNGTTAAPGGYLGFGVDVANFAESLGPRIMAGVGDPNGVTLAPLGSLWLRSDAAGFFRNTDGATAWVAV